MEKPAAHLSLISFTASELKQVIDLSDLQTRITLLCVPNKTPFASLSGDVPYTGSIWPDAAKAEAVGEGVGGGMLRNNQNRKHILKTGEGDEEK